MKNYTELSLEEIKIILNDKQLQILDLYLQHFKQKDIINKLNVTRGMIDSLVKKYKLTRFRSRNVYTINESNLDINNPLYWYFIGWFVSDGNLHKTNSGSEIVQFTLKDKEPLEIIKNILNYTGDIKEYNKTVKTVNEENTKTNYYFLGITNKALVNSLNSILNILYRKTFYIEFPDIIKKECLIMFIRGFWDGDGCFTLNKSNGVAMAAAHCASINFCKKFKEVLKNYDIDVYILNTKCPEIRIYKKQDYKNFVNWLYSIYPNICLLRKKNKAFSLL